MEVYGWNSGHGRSEQYPQQAWTETTLGVGTGTEKSMWGLGLTTSGTYPERPTVSDCVFYLRTGICGFGTRCPYNHPCDRVVAEYSGKQYIFSPATGYGSLPLDMSFDSSRDQATMAMQSIGEEYPERSGERICQHYLKTGNCKFGATCKFDHPKNSGGSARNLLLNYHGYPLRPGERECFYYMRMRECKFGISCKFHHPEPPGVHPEPTGVLFPTTPPSIYTTMQSPAVAMAEPIGTASTGFRMPMPPTLPGSYVPGAYGPMLLHTGVVSLPGWTSYSAPMGPALSPGAQPSVGAGSLYGLATFPSTPTAAGPYSPMPFPDKNEVKFPERPGQPECQYYLRTGACNFGSFCKYHHPLERSASMTASSLNSLGLPLRPGVKHCGFYMRNGFCRFGTTCKFDHPTGDSSSMKHNDPAGSPLPPLPTSLSPDFSPQAARMPSCEATSSALVALTLSETSPISTSNLRP